MALPEEDERRKRDHMASQLAAAGLPVPTGTPAPDDYGDELERWQAQELALPEHAPAPQALAMSVDASPTNAPPSTPIESDKASPEQTPGMTPPASPVASPPPSPAHPEYGTDERAWALLGDRVPEAPDYTPGKGGIFGDSGAEWAALLDVALNRGRGTGQILGAASQLRDKQQSTALDNQLKRAQVDYYSHRGSNSAAELALREGNLEARNRGLDQAGEREKRLLAEAKRRLDETAAKYGAGSPQVKQIEEYYRQQGVDTKNIGQMSMDAVKVIAPTLRGDAQIAKAPERAMAAGEIAAAQEAGRLDSKHQQASQQNADAAARAAGIAEATMPYVQEKARLQSSGTQIGQGDFRERKLQYEQAKDFANKNQDSLDIQGLITELDHEPGGAVPQGFAERFRNSLLARGIAPERLEPWQAKQLVLEKWARSQSGAAISRSEAENFALQTGMSPTAAPQQVQAAYNVMARLIQRRLRGAAVNNPAAADVLSRGGYVDDINSFLGATDEDVASSARDAQAQAPYNPEAVHGQQPQVAPAEVQMPPDNMRQTAAAQEQLPVAPIPPVRPRVGLQEPGPPNPGPRASTKKKKVTAKDLEGF
jgi:hypothetical protein